jgi:beta-galactosidase/beta-glucuronidase
MESAPMTDSPSVRARFASLWSLALAGMVLAESAAAQTWQMKPIAIPTRWAKEVSPTNALPEYPRPQLVRSRWTNLNGVWQFAITTADYEGTPTHFNGDILVPYPMESALSGVKQQMGQYELLWYQRTFARPATKSGERVLLHFGAVDWEATVLVNGTEVCHHVGGYQSFTCDVTAQARDTGNVLVVKVKDPTDQGPNPHGKQVQKPGGIMYTPTTGIWQTVWLEVVPAVSIGSLRFTPDIDRTRLQLQANVEGKTAGYTVEAVATNKQAVVGRITGAPNAPLALMVPTPHLWSPDDPFLYDLVVRLRYRGKVVDSVTSYFGMRKIEIKKDSAGVDRIFLNNRYTYNLGTLDQGFWPDGLYTAPTDAALKFDIEAIKAMGFNTIRKHIKVEPARWYYHADKLGMLVWQDMVNPGNDTPEARAAFEAESQAMVTQLHNYPSITTWVVFNEGWGAYDQARLTQWAKTLDPSRLVNGHTGENYFGASPSDTSLKWPHSDMTDIHAYPDPAAPPRLPGKAQVLGEFGGIGVFIAGHLWDTTAAGWGYVKVTPAEMAARYGGMVDSLAKLERTGLSGSIYTQPFDVEGEQNGLLTYDRAVIKIDPATLRRMHAKLVPVTKNYEQATTGFSATVAETTEQPASK